MKTTTALLVAGTVSLLLGIFLFAVACENQMKPTFLIREVDNVQFGEATIRCVFTVQQSEEILLCNTSYTVVGHPRWQVEPDECERFACRMPMSLNIQKTLVSAVIRDEFGSKIGTTEVWIWKNKEPK